MCECTAGHRDTLASMPTAGRTAWFVLAIVSVANFGNFYVDDSIGPVADLLQGDDVSRTAVVDAFVAGAVNPAGYAPMMLLFADCGAAGFGFALRLWSLDRLKPR